MAAEARPVAGGIGLGAALNAHADRETPRPKNAQHRNVQRHSRPAGARGALIASHPPCNIPRGFPAASL